MHVCKKQFGGTGAFLEGAGSRVFLEGARAGAGKPFLEQAGA